MTFNAGDLLFIPFPYSDLSSAKKRPVLALTAADTRGDFIAVAITSVPTYEHAVRIENTALTHGSLPRTSWIRVDKVFTLSADHVVRPLGTLSAEVLKTVLSGLCQRVGYPDA